MIFFANKANILLFSFIFQYEYYYTYTCSKFGRNCKGLCILILQTTFPLPFSPFNVTFSWKKKQQENKTKTNRKNPDFSMYNA